MSAKTPQSRWRQTSWGVGGLAPQAYSGVGAGPMGSLRRVKL
jgi:hypothetical protein